MSSFSFARLLAVVVLLCLMQTAGASEWQSFVRATNLIFGADSADGAVVYVEIDQAVNAPECAGSLSILRINGDTVQGQYMIAAIISAMATGQQFKPAVAGCDTRNQRPVMTGLQVKP